MLKTSWGVILNWQRDGIDDWIDSFHLRILWSMNSPLGNFSHFRLSFTPPGLSEEGEIFNLNSINTATVLWLWKLARCLSPKKPSQHDSSFVCFLPGGLSTMLCAGASHCKPEVQSAGCAAEHIHPKVSCTKSPVTSFLLLPGWFLTGWKLTWGAPLKYGIWCNF